MNKKQQREIALSSARSKAREMNIKPEFISANDALGILDDINRSDKELICSEWYNNRTENQEKLFIKEWNKWKEERRNFTSFI